MEQVPQSHPDAWFHVRMIMGMVTGLSIARLLSGLARFVQHPGRERVFLPHLLWVFFLLLSVVHFWWFEFAYSNRASWSFLLYFFVILYASLFFFVCVVLFPDNMEEYDGFEGYFMSRSRWFYGLLIALVLVDTTDTLLKGVAHTEALGWSYFLKQALLVSGALVASFFNTKNVHLVISGLSICLTFLLITLRYAHLGQ
jgi:hypothetical protein